MRRGPPMTTQEMRAAAPPKLVDVARLPPGGLPHIAAIYESFDAHLARLGVTGEREHRPSIAPAFRHIALELSSGRLAELNQTEIYSDHFVLGLEGIGEFHTSRRDFDEVCAWLAVDLAKVLVFSGQVVWKP